MLLPPAAGAARIKAKLNATLILYLPRPTRVIAGAQAHSASGRQPAQKFVSGNVPGSESVSSGSGRRAGVCGVRIKSQSLRIGVPNPAYRLLPVRHRLPLDSARQFPRLRASDRAEILRKSSRDKKRVSTRVSRLTRTSGLLVRLPGRSPDAGTALQTSYGIDARSLLASQSA